MHLGMWIAPGAGFVCGKYKKMEVNIKLRDVLDALREAHRAGAVDDARKLYQIANRWLTKTEIEHWMEEKSDEKIIQTSTSGN